MGELPPARGGGITGGLDSINKSSLPNPPYTPEQFEQSRIITSPGVDAPDNKNTYLQNTLCTIPCPDERDDVGHGLGVLSILGAGIDDSTGIVGAAPQASLLPVFTAGEGNLLARSLETLRKAIEEDGKTVHVANISLGTQENIFDVYLASEAYLTDEIKSATGLLVLQNFEVEQFLEKAKLISAGSKKVIQLITHLTVRGVIFVASAGNSGKLDIYINKTDTANFPSVIPWVISVGAYDYNEVKAEFRQAGLISSNYGPAVNIWAPGMDLFVRSHQRLGSEQGEQAAEWKWVYLEGSSFAAPQVAGTVALIKSLKPDLKFDEIKEILQTTARQPANRTSFLPTGQDYPIYFLDALKALQHPKVTPPTQEYNLRVASQGYLVDYEHRVPAPYDNTSPLVNQPNLTVKLFDRVDLNDYLSDYPDIKEGDCVKVLGWTRDQRPELPLLRVMPLAIVKDLNPPTKCKNYFQTASFSTSSVRPTKSDPFSTQSIAFPQSTSYIKVTLSEDLPNQKLYLRHKDLDGNSTATASLSDSPEQHEAQANKVALGTDFTEVGTLSGTQTVIIAVTNSGNTSDFYTVEMALAPADNRRVVLQATSSFSMGATDPVQVVLRLKDSQGKPANGRHRISLDRNMGKFRVLAPVADNIWYTGLTSAYVDAVDGYILLEYVANGVTRDYGFSKCGSAPCETLSSRFRVASCQDNSSCPFIGPEATGPYADEGRIYTTWFNGWGEPQVFSTVPDGHTRDIEIGGLTDVAGRVVPDGKLLFVTAPYYGEISLNGVVSFHTLSAPVQNGAIRFQYKTKYVANSCWPLQPIVEPVYFDDSYYSATWRALATQVTYHHASTGVCR